MVQGSLASYIGDPTLIGWLTVLVYLLATFRCVYKGIESRKCGSNYQFWFILAFFLFCLGINKQLDLQTWFEHSMKTSAQAHGWYEHRMILQQVFIALLGFGMIAVLLSFRLFLANTWRNYALTWMGIVLLSLFIIVRAAAFNRLDLFIHHEILGVNIDALMEIGAILLIIIGTFFNKKQVNSLLADTVSVRDYVEIKKEGDTVRCPQCGTQPLSKTRADRLFKCRSCGFKYTVRVINI